VIVIVLVVTRGVRIGTRQIIELNRAAAGDADAFHPNRARTLPAADPGDAVVITADGKGVPGRSPRPGPGPDERPEPMPQDEGQV
jgi:hypothetical protein